MILVAGCLEAVRTIVTARTVCDTLNLDTMPPKGGNAKKEGGRAKKEENEKAKKEQEAAAKAKAEEADWSQGAKSNKSKEDKEAKKAAEAARKAENARLLALEEASAPTKKAAPKAGKKAAPKPAGPGAIAAGGVAVAAGSPPPESKPDSFEPVESFSATGIDNALDMLSLVNAKSDKASVGQQASKIEAHPERRFKAAFEAYQERELPQLRKDQPGLRLQQYKDVLFKQFQKSPDNPYNQVTVSYDATKEDKVAALQADRARTEERLREKSSGSGQR